MEDNSSKLMAVLSYLGILVLIPIFIGPKTPFVRTHANQGLVIAGIQIIGGVVLRTVAWVPIIGRLFSIFLSVVVLILGVFIIVGIISALQGKTRELPIIGSIKILK